MHSTIVCKFLCVFVHGINFAFYCVKVLSVDFCFYCKQLTILGLNMIYHSRYFHVIFCMCDNNDSCKCQHTMHNNKDFHGQRI